MRRLINILLLMLFSVVGASAQQLVDTPFNGLIVDGSGKGIAKVKITIAGSTKRTSTDKQGRFGLTNLPDGVVLNLAGKGIKDLKVVATGGLGKLIADNTDTIDVYNKMLTMEGLRLIYEKTSGKKA